LKILKRFFLSLIILFAGLYIWGNIYSALQPPLVTRQIAADTTRIKNDLFYLTDSCRFRNFLHINQLNKAASYIKMQFDSFAAPAAFQTYTLDSVEFKNVICSLGPADAERIVIGAHYDACLDQDGADDNASGVCGLLELARLLKQEDLRYRVDFVAYTNEEPPFFGSYDMGSYIHAKSLFDNKVKVKGMICLEMIGYYSEEPGSQDYPMFFLEWFYGNKGNFITVAKKYFNGEFAGIISKRMKQDQVIPTKSFSAPGWVAGIDLSDHRNYWAFDYRAVMITNTAFNRNKQYHHEGDMASRLNIKNMSLVIDELYRTIKDIQ
jgi:hypothetical protein